MRWLVAVGLVSACTTTETTVSATVAHVTVDPGCGDCSPDIDLAPHCGNDMPLIRSDSARLPAYTPIRAEDVAAVVQLQYGGAIAAWSSDGEPHIDFVLATEDVIDVIATYD